MTLLEVQSFFDAIEDCFVGGFGLSVAMWVARRRRVQANLPSFQKAAEVVGNELRTVVGDYFIGETVSADDVFPDEILDFFVGGVD